MTELIKFIFEEFFKLYFIPLSRFITRFTEDESIASDLAQESFLKVYERSSEFPTMERARAFLYSIARNSCVDNLRQEQIKQKYVDDSTECDIYDVDMLNEIARQESL